MNIDYLSEFVHLADTLNFRETADSFYVSRSVISRHMSALEEALGTRLLQRDTRGVKLTDAGEVFCREAKTILRDWEIALDRVRSLQGDGDKLVRIGYLRNGSRPFLVRFVNHMASEHPEIHLSLICMDYQELRRALDEHAIDIAVGLNVDPAVSRNYRSTFVYDDCFYVLCSRESPLASKEGIVIDDLRDRKLLIPENYQSAGLGPVVEQLTHEQLYSSVQTYYRDLDLLYLKVQTEGYLAFVSRLNAYMFEEYLEVLPLQGVEATFSISAFYHDDFHGRGYELCRDGFEWCRRQIEDGVRVPAL